MKKSILSLGKVLNKTEQKSINGGKPSWFYCQSSEECKIYLGQGNYNCINGNCYTSI